MRVNCKLSEWKIEFVIEKFGCLLGILVVVRSRSLTVISYARLIDTLWIIGELLLV